MKICRQAVALFIGTIIALTFNIFPAAMLWADSPKASVPPPRSMADAQATYGHLPLSFEANQGQTDRQVKFLSRGQGYNLFLTSTEAVLALTSLDRALVKGSEVEDSRSSKETRQAVLRMGLVGANPVPTISGLDALPGKANYFIGNDPRHWRTDVPTYVKVQYKDVYPGIDLVFYGNQRQLEYDLIVAPGADPTAITLSFDGADQLVVDGKGDLVLQFGDSDLRLQKPLVYQMINGAKQQIHGNYRLEDQHQIRFQVAVYDRSKPLVIDPTLSYSTYLGGSSRDQGHGIAVDSSGNAYVTGHTSSSNFPTAGPQQPVLGGTGSEGFGDVFVAKLNPTGSALVYSTYLGGIGDDNGHDIVLDAANNAYLTGRTNSTNFPTTVGAFDTTYNGGPFCGDAFVTKLDPSGSALLYSTYLGGSGEECGAGIAVDSAANAYIIGTVRSTDFPTTPSAFQPAFGGGFGDAFVTKLNSTGTGPLLYSTYLGGSDSDQGQRIAIDTSGNAYAVGDTHSTNFPTTGGAFQTIKAAGGDVFVTKLNSTGTAPLVYSTYLGGNNGEQALGITTDSFRNAYVTGATNSTNFPTTLGAFQTAFAGGIADAFVTKLNPAGSAPLVYSTYLGGSNNDNNTRIALDSLNNAYVTGVTDSINFPTTSGAFQTAFAGGLGDAFVTKLNPTGTAPLVYSTYLGGSNSDAGNGIALDPFGNAYVTGHTASTNFPTTTGAFQTTYGSGSSDSFVAKIIDVVLSPAPENKVTGGGTVDVPGGIGNFGFIVQRKDAAGPISGNLNYHNKASGAKIKNSSFTIFAISGNLAVFEGTCTNNGASCTFRVTVTDNGEPGDTDEFTISISGGAEEGGTLRSGNIQIH